MLIVTINFPKILNTAMHISCLNIINTDKITERIIIGIRFNKRIENSLFKSNPPINRPIGHVISPQSIPFASKFISFSLIIPSDSGKVKLNVHPRIEDTRSPENFIKALL